jgi:hypothetical protein
VLEDSIWSGFEAAAVLKELDGLGVGASGASKIH